MERLRPTGITQEDKDRAIQRAYQEAVKNQRKAMRRQMENDDDIDETEIIVDAISDLYRQLKKSPPADFEKLRSILERSR